LGFLNLDLSLKNAVWLLESFLWENVTSTSENHAENPPKPEVT